MLTTSKLGPKDFGSAGHDRGHIAPRQAFSWDVCATYQTFTMANMSPQKALLNQKIWQYLERQVLTWAVDHGPLYVVTGATFKKFPHRRFQVYTNGTLDSAHIYPPRNKFLEVVTQHQSNRESHPKKHILYPDRKANPSKLKAKLRQTRVPTGYYKVVYRPAMGDEPAHAIGFLLPHTFENLNNLPNVKSDEAFWAFVSKIDLIEKTSGTKFPGVPSTMKIKWGDQFFLSKRTGRNIRNKDCGVGTPRGVAENTTRDQRVAMCTDRLR